jgi:hypothetical protein
MNHTGNETAGQCGLVPDQLTKMGMVRQRNVAALYLLRQIGMVECARYVERHLGALHSGRRGAKKCGDSNYIGLSGDAKGGSIGWRLFSPITGEM